MDLSDDPGPSTQQARASPRRLTYIDAVRGMAILSMLTLHLAEPALLTRATHQLLVIDGAHGFVVLAGFVLGLVESRRTQRGEPLSVTRRAARKRILLLVVGHWCVVTLIVLGNAVAGRHSLLTPEFADQSVIRQLADMLTFREMPDNVNILPMYVVFLALAALVYAPLLRAGRVVPVIVISAALYTVSHLGHGLTWFLAPFAPLAWQALFTAGMVTGWLSTEARQLRRRTHPWSLIAAITFMLIPAVLARRHVRSYFSGQLGSTIDSLIDKFQLGFLNLLGGLGLVLTLGVLVGGIEQRGMFPRAMRWLSLLGRRSLACYLTISVLAWLTHLLPSSVLRQGPGDVVILVGVGVTTLVALIRDGRLQLRRRMGLVADPAPAG
mgnify:CR=1 FL=1